MNKKELELIIKEGEGLTIEFKEKYTSRIVEDIVAFSNTRGGFILLGLNDYGKVTGESLTNKMKADINSLARGCDPHVSIKGISQIGKVVVIEIPEGDEKPYSCSSGYFRRLDAVTQKMSQKELRTIFRETVDRTFEDMLRRDCNPADVSLKRVRAFLKESQTSYKVSKANLTSVLASISTYKEGKINNAGVLMFTDDINRFIPYSETILGAFKGTNKTHIYDRKDVRDDLLTQFNESILFLQKHLNVRSEIRGVNRYDIYEIPIDALREAVVNAVIHRDYSMRGTNISVNVFDDRVEIVNPGGLPSGLTKENFGKESVRRNPIIADLFHRMRKVERVGSGIGRMREFMKQAGLKEPVFESYTFFRAVFYRNPEYALKQISEISRKSIQKTSRKYPENIQKIIDVISENPNISMRELMQKLDLTEGSIRHHLFSLKKKGILKRIGPDKGGYWKVIK
ncbi:MAG: winged helix-turn-helix transcriptional regulator [Elusimicrobia bacterium]|nr:winged helix-turn-helix transcriptional regulator [Elusimicrobiota bacterium]MBD3411683.1 winged helix-turn-helix transcriptional regulator [Elusimicrobiota bacterium]